MMKQHGFTLIESMLALSLIVAAIFAISLPFSMYKRHVDSQRVLANVQGIADSIDFISGDSLKPQLNQRAVSSSRYFPDTVDYSIDDSEGKDVNGNIYTFDGITDSIRVYFPSLIGWYYGYHVSLDLIDDRICYSLLESSTMAFDLVATDQGIVKDHDGEITLDDRCTNQTTIYFINL